MVDASLSRNGHAAEYSEPLPLRQRARMLREVLYHQEAVDRAAWENPPIEPGDNASSYADMLKDPAVSYAVSLIKESILSQGWAIQPPETHRGPLAMAVDVQKNLQDLDLESALEDGLSAIWRGFWAHEITWRHAQRRFWLDDLAALDPEQMALELNTRMRVTAVISKPAGHDPQRVDADKLWFHVNKPSRTRPAGESILETAYRAWSAKNRLLQFWGLSLQRFGMAQWKLTIPTNTTPARQAQILSTAQAGRLDGVYLFGEDVMAEMIEPKQWANLTFEQAITYQDAEIQKAILLINAPASSATGQSYVTGQGIDAMARATAHRLQRTSRALCQSFNRQVIQPLCLANWGAPPATCPRLALAPPDYTRIVALAAPLATLIQAGVSDAETAAEQLGLPEPPAAPPPAPTPQGSKK